MRSRRDRFGPAALTAALALLVCSLFIGAPAAQTYEVDTGPQLELVDVYLDNGVRAYATALEAAGAINAAEVLKTYCAESAAAVEIPTVARGIHERARCESGRRPSGVGKRARCADDLERYDWIRPLHGSTPPPLRC